MFLFFFPFCHWLNYCLAKNKRNKKDWKDGASKLSQMVAFAVGLDQPDGRSGGMKGPRNLSFISVSCLAVSLNVVVAFWHTDMSCRCYLSFPPFQRASSFTHHVSCSRANHLSCQISYYSFVYDSGNDNGFH